MPNDLLLQELEDALLHCEHLTSRFDNVTFTETHAQQLLVLRQFTYGLVYELSVLIRANSRNYY